MCGIAAIFAYGADAPPIETAELAAMQDRMAARGPDGAGRWIDEEARLGLAHRRLAVIDTGPAAAQPMCSADGSLVIVHNGEIYNHRELRDRLTAEGRQFVSRSDTEVLLHLYERDGPDMVEALSGMYAFAIWDRQRRGLLLARDAFGIKPLYFADDGKTLRIASQVKALLAGGGIDRRPAPAGHVGFFLWGFVPEPHTLYRGIRALPAGTTLWRDTGGGEQRRHFFDLGAIFAEAEKAPRAATPEALRNALAASVERHLVADVPVGVFLSAGRDSATLVGLASERQPERLRTVTLAFDEHRNSASDEAPLAAATAARYGTEHRTTRLGRADFEAALTKLIAAMDQPSVNGINSYFVARAAAETGLKVALSGLGADELFGGYSAYHQIPRLVGRLAPFARVPMLGRALRGLAAPVAGLVGAPKYAGLVEYGTRYGDAYLLRRALYMPWELDGLLDHDLAREGLAALDIRRRVRAAEAPLNAARLKIAALEAAWYLRGQLLRDADWAGMAHGLEIRVPFVDAALWRSLAPALASATPPDKQAMAATPAKRLPDAVLARPKTGFTVPVRAWLAHGAGERKPPRGRGLRGWAQLIHHAQWGAG
jgi:asparagine synthase (glutamine-hydrolysing)